MSLWFLAVSDLHLGSAFSMLPPDFHGSYGSVVKQNKLQRYIYDNWQVIIRDVMEITGGHLDVTAFVGDMIHGKNRKGEGEFIVEPDLGFQGRAVLGCISPIVDISDEILVCRGSRYHVGANADTEEWIAYTIGARPDPWGHHCWMWIPEYDIEGIILDIAHTQSVTMINRSMPLERERRFAEQQSAIKSPPHIILRAHGHIQIELIVDGDCQIGLPPMQSQTDFAKMSRVPNRWLSKKLGVCLIEIMPELLGTVRQPFRTHWLLFSHPPLGRTKWREQSNKEAMKRRSQLSQILS